MTILAVENDGRALNTLTAQLRAAGGRDEIASFTDAHLAAAYARDNRVDVLFTETLMRGMTGFGLAKLIKDSQPDTVVIFVTDKPDYALDAFGADAGGYLVKPVAAGDIKAKLDSVRKRCAGEAI